MIFYAIKMKKFAKLISYKLVYFLLFIFKEFCTEIREGAVRQETLGKLPGGKPRVGSLQRTIAGGERGWNLREVEKDIIIS
jgi:hypothetical protein